jgi:hypothetical protein
LAALELEGVAGVAEPQRLGLLQHPRLQGDGVAVVAADHHLASLGVDGEDLAGGAVGHIAAVEPLGFKGSWQHRLVGATVAAR